MSSRHMSLSSWAALRSDSEQLGFGCQYAGIYSCVAMKMRHSFKISTFSGLTIFAMII
jgi:hypothetical protein